MVDSNTFHVGVTGDTGFDIYTEYVSGYASRDDRVRTLKAAYDIDVPAGARFAKLAFHQLLADKKPRIRATCILPKIICDRTKPTDPEITLHKYLVQMDRYSSGCHCHGDDKVLRVRESWPICRQDKDNLAKSSEFYNLVDFHSLKKPEIPDLLVIHDGGGSWRRYPDEGNGKKTLPDAINAMDLVNDVLNKQDSNGKSDSCRPRVIIDLNHLPDVERDANGKAAFAKKMTFWNTLRAHKDKVCIVCSANVFRRRGSAISRRLSWEQTIEDLLMDIHLFDELAVLAQFGHLIVRFGIVAAMHISNTDRDRAANFVFAPTAKGGYHRDRLEEGNLRGENVMLIAELIKMVAASQSRNAVPDRAMFIKALKSGLLDCMHAFDIGYPTPWHEPVPPDRLAGELFVGGLFKRVHDNPDRNKYIFGHFSIPNRLFPRGTSVGIGPSDWDILRSSFKPDRNEEKETPAQTLDYESYRINVASAIVLFGHKDVLNRDWNSAESQKHSGDGAAGHGENIRQVLERPPCICKDIPDGDIPDHVFLEDGKRPYLPIGKISTCATPSAIPRMNPIYVPITTCGKLIVVERREVEALQSIRNLMKTYLEHNKAAEQSSLPISIAVFGSPGSGKSFAVKQIADDINSTLHDRNKGLESIEYNVAQFHSVDDLGNAITRASVINNEGKTPLVFFDEFDCDFDRNPLGWLKYFLSPMQDGTFYGATQTIKIPRAIFVFAGGINSSFEAFSRSDNIPDFGETMATFSSEEKARSRAEFNNHKGPDFVSRLRGHINILPINPFEKDHRGDKKKPVIRRSLILRGLLERRGLIRKVRGQRIAQIDEDILFALLTVDKYRHGTRSMEAILQMCTPMDTRIEKTSLPSRSQLDMHVDAEAFYIRMYRGRARPPSPNPPEHARSEKSKASNKITAVSRQASTMKRPRKSEQQPTAPAAKTPGEFSTKSRIRHPTMQGRGNSVRGR